jgi:alkylhydroperoxidase/carboxymuconolactone decarboxylase family protein YurZ
MSQDTAPAVTSPNLERLEQASPGLREHFLGLRKAVNEAGPIDEKHRELILLAAFTTARTEGAFRVHCKRALEAGATEDEIYQAVLLTFGTTQVMSSVVDGLRWADAVLAAQRD